MLHGERVLLRAVRRSDLEAWSRLNNDLEMEVLGGGDPPLPQAPERLAAEFDADVAKGGRDGPRFAIEFEGRMVGMCGLHPPDATSRVAELGIGIGEPELRGRGLGREALSLLVMWSFRHFNLHKLFLRVNGPNLRAQRCYAACGFVEEGRLREHSWNDGRHVDVVFMGLLRSDWLRRTNLPGPPSPDAG